MHSADELQKLFVLESDTGIIYTVRQAMDVTCPSEIEFLSIMDSDG